MLNSKGERELAYIVIIDKIISIEGADNVELAAVGGWRIMVRKNIFNPGDPAIYFEIDSKVPEKEPFLFLASKHYKIKTQKYFKGTVLSQGLLMSAEDFGWEVLGDCDEVGHYFPIVRDDKGIEHLATDESRFLTKQLGVIYADVSDNQRKAAAADKYKLMAQRRGKLFSHQPFRWLMKRTWGKKLLFLFFGRKKDKKRSWPDWVIKTDEERIQNIPWVLNEEGTWIVTEKIDGSSTTFTMKRHGRKFDFYVCSRNVCFNKPDQKCYYDTNIYLEMAKKYDIETKLRDMLNSEAFKDCNWITIQGETYGQGVQNRTYSIEGHDFAAFNLITSKQGRWNSYSMKHFLEEYYKIPCVPIIGTLYALPPTIEEILSYATGESELDGQMREGFVFRSLDGSRSFKAVSNEYLLAFHS